MRIKAYKTFLLHVGTTLEGTEETKHLYLPSNLHFPSIAADLGWRTLPIIDWLDIDPKSIEYAFLREMHVQEIPSLEKILQRIAQEHFEKQQQSNNGQYEISSTLKFFASNFKQCYFKSWSKESHGEYPFLPSYSPGKTADKLNKDNVILSAANQVFAVVNPLFPCLLPEVFQFFKKHCDISLLGIKDHPNLKQAFDTIMKRKNELLTEQSAPKMFAYLSTIEMPNAAFKKEVSQYSFIPVKGKFIY